MRLVSFFDPGGRPRVGRLDGDRVVELRADSMLEWLHGEGHRDAGRDHALAGVRLRAPVPEPPSVRDFYAFEGHVATGWRLRGGPIPETWYEHPVFYFSNPASVVGPGAAVARPEGCERLDLELEVAAVVGGDGGIAGFALLNDWSARDVQRREMTVGLGPAKGKDFATSLGPWLVTPDELPYEDGVLSVGASVSLNGEVISRGSSAEMHWTWPQLLAHAGAGTRLRAGDVLGSGTLHRGCLLELNGEPDEGWKPRWLVPGDVVEIAADGLGTLANPVV